MNELSPRQQKLLAYIRDYRDENQYPPTYAEIQEALNFSSKSHVDYHLKALERKKYIERVPGASRGIRLLRKAGRPKAAYRRALPVYGYVGASEPAWSAAQTDLPDEVIMVTPDIVPDRDNLFGLRVRGDSMIDALVNDGDIVVMQPYDGQRPRNGEMVAVHLHSRDETTLKHFHWRNDGVVRLVPANPRYPVIEAQAEDVSVQGRVVAVIRQF
jgi:repressor LexA